MIAEVVAWGRASRDWVVSYTEIFDRRNLTAAQDYDTVFKQKVRSCSSPCVYVCLRLFTPAYEHLIRVVGMRAKTQSLSGFGRGYII